MDKQNRFQGLKILHQNLHSRKGFTNINGHVGNVQPASNDDQTNEVVKTQRPSEGTESESDLVDGKNNLLKAVKSVYVDNNVKLTQPKIFVGNISYKLSTAQLKEFFSSFGRVIYAQIVKDRLRNRSKG